MTGDIGHCATCDCTAFIGGDDAKFCGDCGHARHLHVHVAPTEQPPPAGADANRRWKLIAGAAATVAVLGFAAIASQPNRDQADAPAVSGKVERADVSQMRTLFEEQCGGCHTLADADAGGTFGPNLDATKPSASNVACQIERGGDGMPAGIVSGDEATDLARYVASASGGDQDRPSCRSDDAQPARDMPPSSGQSATEDPSEAVSAACRETAKGNRESFDQCIALAQAEDGPSDDVVESPSGLVDCGEVGDWNPDHYGMSYSVRAQGVSCDSAFTLFESMRFDEPTKSMTIPGWSCTMRDNGSMEPGYVCSKGDQQIEMR